jgi:hypothetical protein
MPGGEGVSLEALTTVWKHSKADHADLLMMLAIADSMNNAGECWLGTDSIARKARLSVRHVLDRLPLLESIGELRIEHGAGPRGTNLYHLGARYYEAAISGGALSAGEPGSREIHGGRMHPIRKEPKTPSLARQVSMDQRESGALSAGGVQGEGASGELPSPDGFVVCPRCGNLVNPLTLDMSCEGTHFTRVHAKVQR